MSDVGANCSGELLDYLNQQNVSFNITNKKQLEELVRLDITKQQPVVFVNSTKLGSHIKAAASVGVRDLYVDSLEELAKIKRCHGSAR